MKRLLTEASLIMKPEGQSDGLLPSVKPIDGSGDFTFTRGSNLAATRIDRAGLIEKGRENLLVQSNQFDTTWIKSDITLTSNQSGYDGSSDAWLLDTTFANGYLRKEVIFSGISTFSIYAKAGTADGIFIALAASTFPNLKVDLSSQSFISSVNIIDYNIQDVGNGWRRVSFSVSGSYIRVNIKAVDSSGSVIDGTLYIQDAQLEQGLAASPYIETTTTTAQAGVLENTPRLNYTTGVADPYLLLEPSRTNIITQSEYFIDFFSEDPDITIDINAAISPEGIINAARLNFNVASRSMYKSAMGLTGQHSVSFWVKGEGFNIGKTFDVRLLGTSTDQNIDVTLTADWVRFEAQTDGLNTFELTNRSSTTIDTGSLLLYGFQIEEGSYPTSYIPTYSVSQTRAQDLCTATSVSNLIGQTQGTIFIDVNISDNLDTSNIRGIFDMNDGGTNNRISIYRGANDLNIYAVIFDSGTNQASFTAYNKTGNVKIALAYNSLGAVFYINGSLTDTDLSVNVPSCSDIDLGIITNRADRILGGGINQTLLFKTRLTNAELATLTTI